MNAVYKINGLDCAECAAAAERAVKKMREVEDASLSFAAGRLAVTYREGVDKARAYLNLVRAVGSAAEGVTVLEEGADDELSRRTRAVIFTKSNFIKAAGAALFIAAVILQFAVIGHEAEEEDFVWGLWVESVTAAQIICNLTYYAAFVMCGHRILYIFFKRLIRGRVFDENFLMTLVGFGAIILGQNLEACAILIFYQAGELCQRAAVERSRAAIKNLTGMSVKSVSKLTDGNVLVSVPPESVAVGDRVLVRKGEKLAFDGAAEGATALDTSALTGESAPVDVREGDPVYSGSINVQNVFTENVRRQYSDGTIARIMDMVENAAQKKSKSEQFISRFSRVYTPVVVLLAFLAAVPFPLLFNLDMKRWVYTGLIFLIVSCPCALVLSIPMSYFGGIGAASRRGILLKGGGYLDALGKLDTVVFDKTGTLTRGVFEVRGVFPADGGGADAEKELLKKAAYAEGAAAHPVARGIVEAYGGGIDASAVEGYAEYGGGGVSARVNGREILCGNLKLMTERGIDAPDGGDGAAGAEVYVAEDGRYIGRIILGDAVKSDAAEAVADLKSLGVRRVVMLTGDREAAARRVGAELNVDEVRAELLPEDKLRILDEMITGKKGAGGTVFVGEGINDVPAITRADVGVAMGALGSDAAVEAADVVLMTDEVRRLPAAVRIARRTRRKVTVNIVFTLVTKLAIMALSLALRALDIVIPNFILLAEFADVGIALLAVFYAMSILRYDPSRRKRSRHALTA